MRLPIALFAYNRPEHTRRTIEHLKACHGFSSWALTVFCDGPKSDRDVEAVTQTQRVIAQSLGESATIICEPSNKGLARSIIDGVSLMCDRYGRVVVIEDDLLVGNTFLDFMHTALDRYAKDDQVMQISGYMFPIEELLKRDDCFFLPLTTSWGWATWDRAWKRFDPKAAGWELLKLDNQRRAQFNLDGTFDYFDMLKRQMAGKIDSWAIRWYWSVFRTNGLVLYPPQSLVENIGFDGSGTHGWRRAGRTLCKHPKETGKAKTLPDQIVADQEAMTQVRQQMMQLKNWKWIPFQNMISRIRQGFKQ